MSPSKNTQIISLPRVEFFSRRLAKQAGRIAMHYWQINKHTTTKTTSADVLTIADKKIDTLIVKAIKKSYPAHDVFSEESEDHQQDSEYTWIIDPIDGSLAYSHGLPGYAVSIALAQKGKLIFGLVYDPVAKEMFWASKGGGAFLNGQRIHASTIKDIKSAVISTDVPYKRSGATFNKATQIISKTLATFQYTYLYPSSALDMSYVACGRLDGCMGVRLESHDFAGGQIIAEEAGAKTSQFSGQPLEPLSDKKQPVLCANKFIYRKLLRVVR